MQIYTDVGGRPGIDCGGFCRFCFYRNVDQGRIESLNLGCVNCPPHQIGCEKCHALVNRVNNYFKPIRDVLIDLNKQIVMKGLDVDNLKLVIGAGADIFYYPQLMELVSVLKRSDIHLHLGYTCGKAINNVAIAEELISRGLDELSCSVFSTNLKLRGKWMGDKNPGEAVKALKLFCENIDVNASVVAIPRINDEEQIFQTCSDLEEWGVKTFVLRRFANFKDQGLILNNNQPILGYVKPHTYEEFQELVKKIYDEFSFKMLAFPFYDASKNFPFAILDEENRKYLEKIQDVNVPAVVVTSKLAAPFISKFFDLTGQSHMVKVVSVDKEIADLITPEDLESIDLTGLNKNVVIPRGALVHQEHAQEILSRDGVKRNVKRGPYALTHPYYEGLDFDEEELLEYELKSFNKLIDVMNNF